MANLESEVVRQRGYYDIRAQLVILGLFRFSEALAWSSIFSYAFFMIQSLLPDSSTEAAKAKAAALSSLVVAVFTFGEFLMAVPWAKASDRTGRKCILMIGVVGRIITTLAFGLAQNLTIALGSRVLGGLINPNSAVVGACVGEMVKRDMDQGKAFSVVPFLRALGSLIGPVLGGWLAEPVKTMPSVFSTGSLWERYPYLLPNLVISICVASSGLLGFFFLEETHPNHQNTRNIGLELTQWISQKVRRLMGLVETVNYTALPSSGRDAVQASHGEDIEFSSVEDIETKDETPSAPSKKPTKTAYTPQVIIQILAVSILAFHKVSSDVIIPVFLATDTGSPSEDRKRSVFKFTAGFGMSAPSISNVLLSQALAAIVAQVFIVPTAISRWGALKSFRWIAFIFPWLYGLTPFIARVARPWSTICILIDLWIKGILVNIGYIASSILITHTSPSPLHLATVNGAASSLGCLARSVGAAMSGSIFRLGLQEGVIGLPFWTLGAIALTGAILSCFMRDEP
ncbi:hypothetical protein GX51_04740 [Blastomyces parvus]|uniref:Major facilitator superfamily (MFS) profile domain-containing protein n=1 Tax=Blastomyces parvus TaxID=2060905 RepID=A0A2B7X088_9EURO|nr:hypothetical protein GX51_04740 [Blastomyces parvus]